jgi:hypothetical protein
MQAYKIMAQNSRTGIRLQRQFLAGEEITDLSRANLVAQQFAESQTAKDRENWEPVISTYTVGTKPGSQ